MDWYKQNCIDVQCRRCFGHPVGRNLPEAILHFSQHFNTIIAYLGYHSNCTLTGLLCKYYCSTNFKQTSFSCHLDTKSEHFHPRHDPLLTNQSQPSRDSMQIQDTSTFENFFICIIYDWETTEIYFLKIKFIYRVFCETQSENICAYIETNWVQANISKYIPI